MSVLIIAEHDNKELNQLTLNAVTAARELSDNISMFVSGSECQDVVGQCCKLRDYRLFWCVIRHIMIMLWQKTRLIF